MVSSGGVRTLAQLKRRLIETPLASPAAADGAFGALLWVLSELPKPRLALFWETTLPLIARLALHSDRIIPPHKPLRHLLPRQRGLEQRLSRVQAAAILSLAFFDLIPALRSDSSAESSANDEDDEDVAVRSNDKKPPTELPKGSDENVVALNDSLRRDLDSTMEDSDIVEFGTLEIDKAADQYEETFKPSAEHLKRSLDLAREAEQEMLRRQVGGEVVGKSPGNRRGRSVPMDDNDDIDINTIENDDDNNNNNEEEEEISDWDDDDSMEEDNEEALNTTGNKVI